VSLEFNVTAPPVSGEYSFQWRMLEGSAGWFGDFTPNVAITVAPHVHLRTLYSEQVVNKPAFLFGGRGDTTFNTGVEVPDTCKVVSVKGVHYHDNKPQLPATEMVDHTGAHGFSFNSVAGTVRGLDANLHWWHESFHDIKVRLEYTIAEPDGVDCSVPGVTRDTL
jgi:hypothetical protein